MLTRFHFQVEDDPEPIVVTANTPRAAMMALLRHLAWSRPGRKIPTRIELAGVQ